MENKNLKKAFAEVLDMLNYIGQKYTSLIPESTIKHFKDECDNNYLLKLKNDLTDRSEKKYSEEALAIIAYLNLKYWCQNDQEKNYYKNIYLNNAKNDIKKKNT